MGVSLTTRTKRFYSSVLSIIHTFFLIFHSRRTPPRQPKYSPGGYDNTHEVCSTGSSCGGGAHVRRPG